MYLFKDSHSKAIQTIELNITHVLCAFELICMNIFMYKHKKDEEEEKNCSKFNEGESNWSQFVIVKYLFIVNFIVIICLLVHNFTIK